MTGGTPASAQDTIKRLFRALKAEQQKREALEARLAEAPGPGSGPGSGHGAEPVAVIGMACRFPGGANDPDAFWRLLDGGVDAIGTVPPDRWDAAAFLDPDGTTPGTMSTAKGGFLDVPLGSFDYPFFRLSPKEARALDPQQRLLLELSWEALESAGIVPATLKRSRTGVYVGISGDDYSLAHRHSDDLSRIDAYSITGSTPSTAAGRIAYFLGLEGPAIPVDTACSSSLVALHLACQSLRGRETDLTLVGGVNLILAPATHVCFSRLQAISPDGRCKSFAASADGYGRSEGGGMVVLKRLSDALRDGDPILAVVKATAVNQDGASNGFTAPNGAAQKRLLREALDKAGLAPADLQYVEAHGTGTPLGDPIEADALADALCRDRDPAKPLVLGAVKSNIGHLEAAAGMAGLIKVLLALRHGRIPANLHFDAPNPLIPWDGAGLRVPTAPVGWTREEGARHAGISSFGFSGTNAHVILGDPPDENAGESAEPAAAPPAPLADDGFHLLCLSAKTPDALRETARRFRAYLAALPAGVGLRDVCATALRHRTRFPHRLAVAGASAAGLIRALDGLGPNGPTPLDAAAEDYRQGRDLDVDALAPPGGYRRVALPATAFDGRPCHMGDPGGPLVPAQVSIPAAAPATSGPPSHPLLGRAWNSPLLSETLWETTIGLGSHPMFRDHRVFGRPVVPAAATLSLLLAAAAGHVPGRAFDLEDIVFPAALVLPDDGTVTLHLRLRPLEDGRAELRLARLAGDGPVTHATAVLRPADAAPTPAEPVAARWESWPRTIAADDLLSGQGERLTLGPAFRRVTGAKRSGNEALASLDGADEAGDAGWAPSLHPGLIDGGLQLLPALWERAGDEALVPVRIDRLHFPGAPSAPCRWAAARLETGDETLGELRLLDGNGHLLLALHGVHGHPMSADALRRAAGTEPAVPCHRVVWHPAPAVTGGDSTGTRAGTGAGTGADAGGRWIVLASANPSATLPGAIHLIDADGDRLRAAIAEVGTGLAGVVCLHALAGGEDPALAAPVLDVARTLAALEPPPRLWVVTRGAQAVLPEDGADPFQAALWGLGRSLAMEQPRLWGGLLDLPGDPDGAVWDRLPAALLPGERALRGGNIFVPRLETVALPARPESGGPPVRSGVTHLVTGGCGALGLAVAEWLHARGADHLALLGRRPPSPAARARIDALIAKGARIRVLQADVADRTELAAALDGLAHDMPPLAGVFHLAGVLRDGLLPDLTPQRLAEAMAAKALGAWNLDRLTRNRPLDLMVFFSSAGAVLGAAGQANYAAANAFLDALAARRRRAGLVAASVGWGPWAGGGMAAGTDVARGMERLGFTPLPPAAALDTLERLLAAGWSHAVALAVDWRRYRRALPAGAVPELLRGVLPDAEPSRLAAAATGVGADRAGLAAFLARTAAEALGATPGTTIDADQDLFELGLDSLMALRMRNAIEGELEVSLPATILFDHPTIARLCDAIANTAPADPAADRVPTVAASAARPGEAGGETRLSAGQQGLWFLQQLAPDSAAFHTCFTARIRSALDVGALERAFRLLLDRHPALRARFTAPDGIPRQDPAPADGFAIERAEAADADEEALRALVADAYRRPFRLDSALPMRVALWRRAEDDHILLIAVHHISIDVWSFERLLDEVKRTYAALLRGETAALPPPAHGYGDFVRWQRDLLAGERGRVLRDHWRERLAGAPPAAAPPLASRTDGQPALGGRSLHFSLDRERTAELERMSQENGTTLTVTLLAAWLLLVGRLSGRDDVIVGTPALGRSERAWTDTLGFFVNVLPIRASLSGDPSWPELVRAVRRAVLDAIAHQDLPFSEIAALAPEAERDGLHPLFTTLFHLRNLEEMGPFGNAFIPGRTARIPFGPLEIEPFFLDQQEGQYPLTMEWFKAEGQLHGVLKHDTGRYDDAAAAAVAGHYVALLSDLLRRPTAAVRSIDLLTDSDRAALARWHDTARPRADAAGGVIHRRFAAQARCTPDAVALTAGAESLTYRTLDRRANALAHGLAARGAGPGALVGICVERSVAMVVGMLAVLKTGAAYVPLSPEDPSDRLAALTREAGVALVLAQPDRMERFAALGPDRILPAGGEGGDGDERDDAPAATVTADDLAYVLFTSGTTGTPKGVMVAHGSVANCLDWLQDANPLDAGDAMLGKTPTSFDPSVTEIFWPLIVGARLVLAKPDGHRDPAHLVDLMARERITAVFSVPSQWRVYLDEPGIAACTALRWVACGGEPLPAALIRRFRRTLPGARLLNVYGPTEATVLVSAWTCPDDPDGDAAVMIGGPIANSRLHVLDEGLSPLPVGVPGMLHIGGRCLARGYLGRPDLTERAFVPDPFSADPAARLYRTGDMARLVAAPDGGLTLQFLGRADHQVKLRGMRLETGEVEAALRRHPGIAQAAVRLVEAPSGEPLLGACVVPVADAGLRDGEAAAFLEDRLPGWMVPRLWASLPALPLTAHDKIDGAAVDRHLRAALARRVADPAPGATPASPVTASPATDAEAAVAAIWRDLLNLPAVTRDAHFFDLGGTSLMLARLRWRLEEAGFGQVPMTELFRHPTVASLAARLSAGKPAATTAEAAETAEASMSATPRAARANAGSHAVAVIGMAARLPGAADIDAFWDNLTRGVESIRRFPRDELLAAGVPPSLLDDPAYVPANGVLDGVEAFDAGFFGYSPREAETLDPQHRLFLETVWHALEHGGYGRRGLAARVGVYAGSEISNYLLFNLASRLDPAEMNGGYALSLANDKDFLATRASYALDLRGPGLTVQTACSTSLSAVAMACDALAAGHCDMALAGGVSIQLPQIQGYTHREGMVASADGHCRPFDAGASGTVNGNGVGVVLLKPLARALADGDTVHAVLAGWALNNDGSRKLGYTAPNADAQARALADAWAHAGIAPADLGCIEAHGTGTPLGDPIEVSGLIQAWGDRPRPPNPCLLGSVKGNIGHLGAASGVAGLIKTVLMVRHGRIPPSLHVRTPNPEIPFAGSPFAVNAELRDWPEGPSPRRAGVSSFGIGGTNVHVVVEQAPPRPESGVSGEDWQVLPVSAGSAAGLDDALRALAARLERPDAPPLADAAFTLQEGRSAFAHRAAVVVRSVAEARAALARAPRRRVDGTPEVAFLFPGQGAQHPGMLRGLCEAWPEFRREIDRGLALLAALDGTPAGTLRTMLHPDAEHRAEAAAFLGQTRYTQPILFIVEHALARLWQGFGVEPSAMIGHSVGEYAAAALAGIFAYEDALRLVAARGRLMQGLPPGAMLAVNLPAAEVADLLTGEVGLAGDNGPTQCVLSGPAEAIAAAARALAARGVTTHALATSHAFHSAMMDPILEEFRRLVAGVERRPPRVPIVSCLTGEWLTDDQALDPDYWVRQLRGTVRFRPGVETLLAAPGRLLLEVGPGRTLSAQAQRIAQSRETAEHGSLLILASARRENESRDDRDSLLSALAALWTAGVEVRWRRPGGEPAGRRVPLPLYPFDRRRYWVEAPRPGQAAALPPPATLPERADPARRFYVPRWSATSLPPPPTRTVDGDLCLVFADAAGVAERLALRLRAQGWRVVTVHPDAEALPHRADAYAELLASLRRQGPLRRIVHAWTLGGPPTRVRTLGLESLLFLGQALAASQEPVELVIVGAGVQDVAADEPVPAQAALLLGPALVIPRECPWVGARLLDLDPLRDDPERTAGRILAELDDPRGDRLVAYRRNRRWVRDFQPLTIEDGDAGGAEGVPAGLRPEGVYLITGGLGGIGLEVARFLARRCRARLILCGRGTPAPDDPRQEILREMAGLGAAVTVVAADVTDPGAMAALVARVLAEHGALHGVVHAAGTGGHGAITAKTPEGMARVLAPKLEGTLALADALTGLPLDFLALFSSSSAVLGAAGLLDYAAANAFLDAFAHRRSAAGLPTLAIGWDAWADTGLSRGAFQGGVSRKQAAQALSVAEGLDAFARILGRPGLPHVLVSPTDLNALMGEIATAGRREEAGEPPSEPAVYERPDLATSFVAPGTPAERRVAALWQEILGIRTVGIRDNFFDLGGDSLVGSRLVARLNREFGASLPAVTLYETPTVESLARRLDPAETAPSEDAPARRPPPTAETGRQDSRRARRDRKRDDFLP
ncbi:non-ribosomal peptide synthetase/type I polyketide synthase [Azospirillum agricola]|uniref:non-ribosomal peptide synthetase/type I polyketide synthase n=1 Tax=Azospirillum agricola TaxID=1720247 RepID=UPI000A0F30A3|nr:non-ribosomal peptide synthetase/type I polyketide synthase [Azospirillum agricola]SMH62078.1 amino acid adenylation domain-containing protein [Azospirillum lipoferum]